MIMPIIDDRLSANNVMTIVLFMFGTIINITETLLRSKELSIISAFHKEYLTSKYLSNILSCSFSSRISCSVFIVTPLLFYRKYCA